MKRSIIYTVSFLAYLLAPVFVVYAQEPARISAFSPCSACSTGNTWSVEDFSYSMVDGRKTPPLIPDGSSEWCTATVRFDVTMCGTQMIIDINAICSSCYNIEASLAHIIMRILSRDDPLNIFTDPTTDIKFRFSGCNKRYTCSGGEPYCIVECDCKPFNPSEEMLPAACNDECCVYYIQRTEDEDCKFAIVGGWGYSTEPEPERCQDVGITPVVGGSICDIINGDPEDAIYASPGGSGCGASCFFTSDRFTSDMFNMGVKP